MLRTHQLKVALVTALLVLSALLPVAAGAAPGTKRIGLMSVLRCKPRRHPLCWTARGGP